MDTVRWDNPSLSTGWDMGALDAGPFSPIEANTMQGFETILGTKDTNLDQLLDPFFPTDMEQQLLRRASDANPMGLPYAPSTPSAHSDLSGNSEPELQEHPTSYTQLGASSEPQFDLSWRGPSGPSSLMWSALQEESSGMSRGPSGYTGATAGIMADPLVWYDVEQRNLHQVVSTAMSTAQAGEPLGIPTMPNMISGPVTFSTAPQPMQTSPRSSPPHMLFSLANERPVPPAVAPVVMPVAGQDVATQAVMDKFSLAAEHGLPTPPPAPRRPVVRSPTTAGEVLPTLTKSRRAPARMYECLTCHKMFERAYNRKMHMTTHEAIENRLKPFVCPLEECGKQFARKHDRNRHYMGVHLHMRKSRIPSSGQARDASVLDDYLSGGDTDTSEPAPKAPRSDSGNHTSEWSVSGGMNGSMYDFAQAQPSR